MLQAFTFLVLDLVVFIWRQMPVVGRFAGPVTYFASLQVALGFKSAAVLSMLGLWGPLSWYCFQFARLWRLSRVQSNPNWFDQNPALQGSDLDA